jgi:hypothetical protein
MRPLTTESGSSTDSGLVATPPSFGPYLDVPLPVFGSPAPMPSCAPALAFSFSPGAHSAIDPMAGIFSYFPQDDALGGDPFDPCGGLYESPARMPADDHFAGTGVFPSTHTSALTDGAMCRCLSDGAVYGVVSELALRVRQALGLLGQHPLHMPDHGCALQQRISDLEAFTT